MSRIDDFEDLRPLLFSIAYRILGSVSEAEDAVQEAWLRYETSSLLTDPYEDPERSAELADSVSMAALLLLEQGPHQGT
jgi:RNA polymerase sigma-70 factor (ECF subfamily)